MARKTRQRPPHGRSAGAERRSGKTRRLARAAARDRVRPLPALQKRILTQLLGTPAPAVEQTGGCACLCVVKDEAPYVHEYIHHHLWFGFTPIIMMVNRTTDTTERILQKISARHAEVVTLNCDMIDYLGVPALQMQLLGYAYGIAYLRARTSARYALINDTDEFWFPTDFSTNVDRWTNAHFPPDADQVSFCWYNQLAREEEFRPPFENLSVELARNVKSMIRLGAELRATHYHYCALRQPAGHKDPRGRTFVPSVEKPYQNGGVIDDHSAYVLHRLQRSEAEYVSTLARGNPQSHTLLKENRRGYRDTSRTRLDLPAERLSAYHLSLRDLVAQCDLEEDLAAARAARRMEKETVEARIKEHLRAAEDPVASARILARIFSGTAHEAAIGQLRRSNRPLET